MLHEPPFQCIANGMYGEPPVQRPAAQMSLPEVAVTAFSSLIWPVPPGLGLGTTFQLVPSQGSVSVCVWPPSAEKEPTAQALAGDSAVTDEKTAPAGPFTVDDVHCDPFQCSSAELVVSGSLATAQASVAESALTEKTSKPSPDTSAGRGDGVQFVPSQRIIVTCTGP